MFSNSIRDAPNMLKNLPIIPSRTSQNLSLLFFKISPIIPLSKKITQLWKVSYNIEKVHKLIVADESLLINMHL